MIIKKSKKVRLNVNKIKVSLFFCILLIIISLGLKATAANFTEEKENPAYIEVMVKSGDSLWKLTEIYYKGNNDIRKTIYRIKEINNLESAEIVPGQIIKIPQV